MRLPSAIAIFALFWAISFFLVLPFRPGGTGEGAHVPGQADSAPPRFAFGRTCAWTTLVAGTLFVLFMLNYRFGWLTPEQLNLVPDRVLEAR